MKNKDFQREFVEAVARQLGLTRRAVDGLERLQDEHWRWCDTWTVTRGHEQALFIFTDNNTLRVNPQHLMKWHPDCFEWRWPLDADSSDVTAFIMFWWSGGPWWDSGDLTEYAVPDEFLS